MSGNTFGRLFRLTTYGESHGRGLGGIIDGCPSGLPLTEEDLQHELDARRPGFDGPGGTASTARVEKDRVRLLSGIFRGVTTGTPIAFHVENEDQRSADYTPMAEVLRPGHADLGFHAKFGIRDHRGGGRSSGRETLTRVAGGAVAGIFLATLGITVRAYTIEIGGIPAPLADIAGASGRPFFAPDDDIVSVWEKRIRAVKDVGDSVGGLVRVEAFGLPAGLGEPVFDKLDARLAYACMSIGAVKGIEFGRGFEAARLLGSENNDQYMPASGGCSVASTKPASKAAAGSRAAKAPAKTEKPSAAGKGAGNAKSAARKLGPIACSSQSLFTEKNAPSPPEAAYFPSSGHLPCGASYGFTSNHAGGILGGMSNGAPLVLTIAVKPISSISREQRTITLSGDATRITVGGRHDISAIPRIVPVLKAMTALTLADFILLQRRLG